MGAVTKRDTKEVAHITFRTWNLQKQFESCGTLPRSTSSSQLGYGGLFGTSTQMRDLYEMIQKVSQSNCPVLLRGETGTGKELAARSIHFASPRSSGPFVPIDCTALSPGLVESELFGHVKGAFTGAGREKRGLMEAANGGVLFMDEIGDLDISLQAKLLRAIQEKEIRPVGSTRCAKLHVRFIAATNRNLETAILKGTFRQDLYFRLNVAQLSLPPLREHKSDIPLLVEHFVKKFTELDEASKTVSGKCMAALLAYHWPGNVRELGNAIERAMAFSSGGTIELGDLPDYVESGACKDLLEVGDTLVLAELERRAIQKALERTGGDKIAASLLLKMGKTTLYRRLNEYRSSPW